MFSNLQFISLRKQPGVIQRWLDSLSVPVSVGCASRLGIVLRLAVDHLRITALCPLGSTHRVVMQNPCYRVMKRKGLMRWLSW